MGWFKKKSDPILARARALNDQIAHLEAQIKHLSEKEVASREETVEKRQERDEQPQRPAPVSAPKLRSTALPQGHGRAVSRPSESGLEDLSRNPFKPGTGPGGPASRDLGVNESDFSGLWKRFKRQFRGPVTSNPKLVSYLAAGSIQGLRPLRYEKRVARNRTILLLVCLILILWGILAIVIR